MQNFSLLTTENFIKEATELKKKYPNISYDFRQLGKIICMDPYSGNDPLGGSCYKIRMNISDKKAGKSGGARVIIQVKVIDRKIFLLSVLDKSVKENLENGELERLIKNMVLSRK